MVSYIYNAIFGASAPEEDEREKQVDENKWNDATNEEKAGFSGEEYHNQIPQFALDKPEIKVDREKVKQELKDLADEYLKQWDELSVVIDKPDENYFARQVWVGDGPLTIIKYRAEGLTAEHLQAYMDDPIRVQIKMNNRASACRLPDSDGCLMYKLHMRMPAILYNRSIFLTYYFEKGDDGSFYILGSSRGNDEYADVYADEVGNDVIANAILITLRAVPCEGGYDLTQIISMDPSGWIPWFLKRKMGHRSAEMIGMTVNFLKTGEVPPPLF